MTKNGITVVLEAARQVQKNDPSLLAPIGDFFNVDIEARLEDERLIHGLIYETY